MIITADHECGGLWGPGEYAPIPNPGKGVIPEHKYTGGGHTNALVPVFTKGAGSELFEKKIDGTDVQAGKFWQFDGRYIDNTDIFEVMRQTLLAP